MKKRIAVMKGDGIGPDIVNEALKVLDKVGEKFGHTFEYTDVLAGGAAIDATGGPLPQATIDICKASDSVILGALGGPMGGRWDTLPGHLRPEAGLLKIRKELGVFANLRPVKVFKDLRDASPLKSEIIGEGFDFIIFRELTGGIYFGEKSRDADGNGAYDTEHYQKYEIERILHAGFKAARKRINKLCLVDKANVLESSRYWREVMAEVAKEYPEVEVSYMYVDNAAMQLIRNPKQFDVIVTSNMFGDILSDEASMITGSIGMLASASLGDGPCGLYEPIHGSAPDIAGKNLANPLATILSVAMMLRHSFDMEAEAKSIEKAIDAVLAEGYRTKDICDSSIDTSKILGTIQMGDMVAAKI